MTLSDRLNHYRKISHEIFDTQKLYDLFIDTYHNVLFQRFKYYFNFPTQCYLRYRIQFIKNQFICSNVLSHLFDCPRSEFGVNNCYRCSRLYVTLSTFFAYLEALLKALYRMISTEGAFSDALLPLFEKHSMNRFSLKGAYESHWHYEAIMSQRERCLELFMYYSPHSIILMYCEVFLRILYNFFWSVSKDFVGGQRYFFLTVLADL